MLGVSPGREQEQEEEEYKKIDDYEIDQVSEKKMESLIMSLEVFCFKENLSVKQFFDCIHSMYLTAEKSLIVYILYPSNTGSAAN